MVELSGSDLSKQSTIEAEQLQEISIRHSRADGAAENSVSPHGGVNHSRAGSKGRKLEEIFQSNFKAATTLIPHVKTFADVACFPSGAPTTRQK